MHYRTPNWLMFNLRVLPPPPRAREVIDPRTGRHIFAKTDREVKIRVLPEQVEPPPSPTLFVNPSGKTASIAAQATHAINLGMYTARSSMQGSTIVRSTSHGFKKAKNTALLTLKIGQFVVKTQVRRERARERESDR